MKLKVLLKKDLKNKWILLGIGLILLIVLLFTGARYIKTGQQIYKPPAFLSQAPAQQETCKAGYVLVPGNKSYATSDFCAMKYDAKCAYISDLSDGIQPTAGNSCSVEGIYRNNGKSCPCTPENGRQVVSTKSGAPITYIAMSDNTPNNALTYCQSIRGHLITNSEWMTIARNVEQVKNNWCDKNGTNCGFPPGVAGKILANGYNDTYHEASASAGGSGALIAGDDSQPCFGTTTDGSNTCGGKNSQKRTLTLSNGNILWDFAGNVWQWVNAQVMRKDEPESKSDGVLDLGWTRSDFAPGSLPSVITDNGQGSLLGYDTFRPSNPLWNANNGVGRIYHYSDPNDTSTVLYTFIRGGNWRHFDDDGAFTIHMSPPANTEGIDDVGFRCVTSPQL